LISTQSWKKIKSELRKGIKQSHSMKISAKNNMEMFFFQFFKSTSCCWSSQASTSSSSSTPIQHLRKSSLDISISQTSKLPGVKALKLFIHR
jgi:hypothetical protein